MILAEAREGDKPQHRQNSRGRTVLQLARGKNMPALYALFLLLTMLLTAWVSYNTYLTARLLRTWRPPSNPLLHPLETVVRLGLIALCIALGFLSGLPPDVLGWTANDPWRQTLWGIIAGAALGAIFLASTRWVVAQTGQRYYSPLVLDLILPKTRREFILTALAMVAVVLLEELLFRSLLIGGLMPLLPGHWLVLGFGLLFGLLHSPQGLWGMAGAALAGMLLGALFLAAHSLLLPCVAHYVANMVQVGVAYRERAG
jgi:membrane protease YdiL (CAAX protease family)